jgi:hypothetical protein
MPQSVITDAIGYHNSVTDLSGSVVRAGGHPHFEIVMKTFAVHAGKILSTFSAASCPLR